METGVDESAGALVRLWRGEYGLGRTYWLLGWVVSRAYDLVALLLVELDRRSPGSAWDVAVLGAGILYVAYHLVWSVWIWRAARAYRGHVPLAVLAVLMAVASWLGIGWSYWSGTSPSGVPPEMWIRW